MRIGGFLVDATGCEYDVSDAEQAQVVADIEDAGIIKDRDRRTLSWLDGQLFGSSPPVTEDQIQVVRELASRSQEEQRIRAAIASARSGDKATLAGMLKGGLTETQADIVVDLLAPAPRRAGRPKSSIEQRRGRTRSSAWVAASLVGPIRRLLIGREGACTVARATMFAAAMIGIKVKSVESQIKRPKSRRLY